MYVYGELLYVHEMYCVLYKYVLNIYIYIYIYIYVLIWY